MGETAFDEENNYNSIIEKNEEIPFLCVFDEINLNYTIQIHLIAKVMYCLLIFSFISSIMISRWSVNRIQ